MRVLPARDLIYLDRPSRPISWLVAGITAALAVAAPAAAQFQITPQVNVLAAADFSSQIDSSQPESAQATALGSFRLRGQSKGYAQAALATGALNVLARSVAVPAAYPGGSGRAQFEDEITITGPVGAPPVTVNVELAINGLIDLGPTSSFEGTTPTGSVSNFTRAHLFLMMNSGPFLGVSVGGELRQTATGSFSADSSGQLQTDWGLYLQELPADSPLIGSPFGFVSIDTIRTTRYGLEGIITVPITVSPGDRFRVTAMVETAAYSSPSYISYSNFYDNKLLDLALPPGYGYTSTSGVLLSQPVPEPSAVALLSAGGLAMACRGRRRPN